MKKVSIIIPLYKGNKYLLKLINCVNNNIEYINKHKLNIDVEVVFVNDFPEIEIELPKIEILFNYHIVNNLKNLGIHQSRINGIKKCTGDYVIMLDQDDYILENCVASQMDCIKDADFVVSNGYRNEVKESNKFYNSEKNYASILSINRYIYYSSSIYSPGQVLIKKEAIPQFWLTHPLKNNGADDTMLWILMLEKKSCGIINKDILYVHVNTGENTSLNMDGMCRSNDEMIDYLETIISKRKRKLLRRRNDYYKNLKNGFLNLISHFDICLIRKLYYWFFIK